jgi:hypothetical protein
MTSRISALVSGYYSEDYIETRLINLKKQDCEIVLICQAGSAEHEIGMQYGLTPILTPDIPPLYTAWNMGIKQSQGKYLTSANTDDLFHDNALTIMADELDRTGAAICHSWLHRNTGGTLELWERTTGDYNKLKTRCFPGPMPMWRKSLHEKYGYFDESFQVAGDWEFWLRVMKAGEKACHIERSLGVYLWRKKSLERRDVQLHIKERERIRKMYK